MTKVQEKYKKNQELISNYANSHKEFQSFINSLKETQIGIAEGKKAKLTISAGELNKEGFLLYLTSNVKNPRILFSSFKDDKTGEKIPQVIISDRSNTIVCFTLDFVNVHIISSRIENDDNVCPFDRYNFMMHFDNQIDYDISMVIYKK